MAAEIFGSLILWLVVVAIVVVIAVYLLRWLYRRSTKETAFVRTGRGGEKVVGRGGGCAKGSGCAGGFRLSGYCATSRSATGRGGAARRPAVKRRRSSPRTGCA